ncbi:copper chaperone PCu(A)C [Actinomadura madurae]|uniref:Copper(I)-binding protein n=1 Tax=Actinomadura madurae TaxID=1993 RepID=A0A1I5WNW9_9ACTN|nr:copper chaperone PCu(A)C [Actinomadura madurae]SFQ21271.1 Protein of unknown function [Actinomadura madurae]SPT51790.1 Uncharacterised protein [Actinomadura madurae]
MDVAQLARAFAAPAVAALLAGALLAGCGDDPTETDVSPAAGISGQIGAVDIRDLFVLGGQEGETIQRGGSVPVYMTLVDSPSDAESLDASGSPDPRAGTDRLTAVSSPQAASAEIVGGTVRLPAGGNVRIGPKPTIVLRGLKQAVQSGQFVPITFRFERSGSGSLNVPVQAREGDLESYSPAP